MRIRGKPRMRGPRLVKRRTKLPQKAVPRGERYWPAIWLSTAPAWPLIHDFARLCALLTASGCARVPPNSLDLRIGHVGFLAVSQARITKRFCAGCRDEPVAGRPDLDCPVICRRFGPRAG